MEELENKSDYDSIDLNEKHYVEIAELFDYAKATAEERSSAYAKYKRFMKEDVAPRYLYIIRCHGTTYYKIGITNDLAKRLAAHQTGNPNNLTMVLYAEADLDDYLGKEIVYLESFLHKNYSHFRVRGEWFNLNYHHISDIALFLELNRELGIRICSRRELVHYYKYLSPDDEREF
ncbi:hypothetical protein PS662_01186 [Pseudomonas fluorescens]|uniref:Bacteriophage T5 Orf172 DNA-binding domain-containing protein n=1 Tax=Pseudomonas fluorescens TaxID=294 RepID=A0A5E6QQQ4_PSEFL|nr:GIY-YIG nuclease family protein [Pseudomonas fluorescens]VVM58551.1 hypothetical protein PS662_01186 [Pseudomonas fluorescens]